MFFRLSCGIVLAVLVSLAGAVLERHNLELRRRISHQQFRMGVLREKRARLTLRVQELGAPTRVMQRQEANDQTRKR